MKKFFPLFALLISLVSVQPSAQANEGLPVMTIAEVNQFMVEHPANLVVVLLSAKWCMACHRVEPYYVKAAEALKDEPVTIVKMDFDLNPEYVKTLNINSIPQTEFFYQGVHRWKYGSGLSDTQLIKESRLALEAAKDGSFEIKAFSVLQRAN
jgi:thiol-disulfide isomerase/thioredoxin